MEIKYLERLKINNKKGTLTNKGLSLEQISHLEIIFNNANPFPKVLKELLFLAGEYCGFLEFGAFEDQEEMQNEMRSDLLEFNNLVIIRPFFCIDIASYSAPVFMFLDEGDNPTLCQILREPTNENYYRRIGVDLKEFINISIENYLNGEGAF